MATQHPRVALVKDDELRAALELTRRLLDPAETRSEAGHVRRLALLGAGMLIGDTAEPDLLKVQQRFLSRPGLRLATRSLTDLPWLASEPIDQDEKATGALNWVRGQD